MKTIALLLIAGFTLSGTGSASQTNLLPAARQAQSDRTKQAVSAKAEVQERAVGEKSQQSQVSAPTITKWIWNCESIKLREDEP